MDQNGISKTRSVSWNGMCAILVIALMVVMAFTPIARADADTGVCSCLSAYSPGLIPDHGNTSFRLEEIVPITNSRRSNQNFIMGAEADPNPHVTPTYYTDRPTFDAQNPGLPIEDFEEASIGAGTVDSFFSPLDETTTNAYFIPGDILPGIQFTDGPVANNGGQGIAILGSGFMGNPSINIVANMFVQDFEILFNPPVKSAGMNFDEISSRD